MTLMHKVESDKEFGQDVMKAAGIRLLGDRPSNGLELNMLIWCSNGQQIGPAIAFFGNEFDVQLMWPYRIKEPRIYQQTIKKLLPIIKQSNHTGCVYIRCLVRGEDKKAYGIRIGTTITQSICKATANILKVKFSDWTSRLQEGLEGDHSLRFFHCRYSGAAIERLTDLNIMLMAMRVMGYEIPDVINASSEGQTAFHEHDQSHQSESQAILP